MSRKSSAGTTFGSERRVSQYEFIMKRYSNQHEEEKCKYEEIIPRPSPHTHLKFETGSSYEGGVDIMGMNGYGEYTFPNGVLYRGEFRDGTCHGTGELVYKDGPEAGCIIRGTWVNGVLTDRKIIFEGILEYEEDDWKYCKLPDRRYVAEFETDLQPAGKSFVAPEVPAREIPPGYYDTGDGFYHPETKVVYKYENMDEVTRAPSAQERKWIVENCRMGPLGFIGPRLDFYETWLPPLEEPTPPPEPVVAVKPKVYHRASVIVDQESTEQVFGPIFYDASCYGGLNKIYVAEFETDLQPAGKSFVAPEVPAREIPPGYYDTGDGFYHPETKVVYKYENMDEVTRAPSAQERKWIVENCRMGPLGFIGPRLDFYETWLPPLEEPTPPPEPVVAVKPKVYHRASVIVDQESTEQVFGPIFYDASCYGGLNKIYVAEFETDLQPAGKSFVAPEVPAREIPPGYYDTGDGFYHPETKVVYKYENMDEVTRAPSAQERKWIVENCRMGPLGFIGPRLDFYETWLPPLEEPTPPPEPVVAVKPKVYHRASVIVDQESTEQVFGPIFYDASCYGGLNKIYVAEFETDLQPAGKSFVAPEVPAREIPPGYYDTGDGFYHPETKVVYKYENMDEVTRAPSAQERKWIVENCRMGPLGFIGPRLDFYETWLPPLEEPTPPPEPVVAVKPKVYHRASVIVDQESTEQVFGPIFYDASCYGGLNKM